MRGRPYVPEEPEPEPNVLPGSCIAFTCNGELQGVAYRLAITRACSRLMSSMDPAACVAVTDLFAIHITLHSAGNLDYSGGSRADCSARVY